MSASVCVVFDGQARQLRPRAVPRRRRGRRVRRPCDCNGCRFFRHYGFVCIRGRHLDQERWS